MRILHFADVHIGVETHGRLDASTGLNTRLLDFVRCLEFVVDVAIERKVDAVLFAGDAYDHANPTPTYEKLFSEQIRRLSEAGIPTVLIVGNHDMPVTFGRASPLELFGVLGVPYTSVVVRPTLLTINTSSGPLQVACLPYPNRSALMSRDEYRSLPEDEIRKRIEGICAHSIEDFASKVAPAHPSILLAHISAANATYSGSERTALLGSEPILLTGALVKPAFSYVALGHIHKHQDMNPSGHPHVVYSGSIERTDFSEENEPKGFCIVHINGSDVNFEFIETPARRFVTIEADLHGASNPTEAFLNIIAEHDIRDAIVRVSYRCADEQQAQLDWNAINNALVDAERIATITRQVEQQRTAPRAAITERMSVAEALRRYIHHHDELHDMKDELLAYAQRLEAELRGEV